MTFAKRLHMELSPRGHVRAWLTGGPSTLVIMDDGIREHILRSKNSDRLWEDEMQRMAQAALRQLRVLAKGK